MIVLILWFSANF